MIFLVASLTDLVDGYLARSRGEVTDLGKLADPVADKILLLAGVMPLVEKGEIPAWLALVIFAREFAIMGLRSVVASKGKTVPADFGGKVKTVVYTFALVLLVFNYKKHGMLALYIGVIISLLSAVNYFRQNMGLLE